MNEPIGYGVVVLAGSALIAGLRLLTVSATAVAALMAALLLLVGGWAWLTPALTFLFLAALWTRWPGASRDRDRTRGARQVLANGLAPMLASGLALIQPEWTGTLALAVTGAYAAAAADTWATEWGGAFGGRPLDLRTLRLGSAGRSGAISVVGTFAGAVGAASVAVACALASMVTWEAVPLLILAGMAGSLLDSLAGAWLQGIWTGEHSEPVEERSRARSSAPVRGLSWIDNDAVNVIATASGALLAVWWV